MRRYLQVSLVSATLYFLFHAVPGFILPAAHAQTAPQPGNTPPDQRTRQMDAAIRASKAKSQAKPDASTPQAALPQFSVPAGSYSGTQTVSISDSTPGATIYCTTNGTPPSLVSTTAPCPSSIAVSSSEILVAIATAPGYANSNYAYAQYNIASSSVPYIYTIAGNDTEGYSGDGGSALLAQFGEPQGVATDSSGNIYVADFQDNVVRKISTSTGIISTVAGTGVPGHAGDGGPAISAELWKPVALAIDSSGNLYVSEYGDEVIRKVDASTGVISTYAGNPAGTGGSGSPATSISFNYIVALACDSSGNLYVGDYYGSLWKINATNGIASYYPSSSNDAFTTTALAFDKQNNLYVADNFHNLVYKVDTQGNVTVVAGGYINPVESGDGGPATSAYLYNPSGVAVDSAGNLYIADTGENEIRKVTAATGIISAYAGNYEPSFDTGDGGPATSVGITLAFPQYIALDSVGNMYLDDFDRSGIQQVTAPAAPPIKAAATPAFSVASGTYPGTQTVTISDATPGAKIYVTLHGGTVSTAYEGYHGPITVSGSATIQAVAVGPGYLPSATATATYTISAPPNALISTVAGTEQASSQTIGGVIATSTPLANPYGIAFDSSGNLYIADTYNDVILKVAASTQIATIVAGSGILGSSGDNGPATAAELNEPYGVAVDKAGNLYIADTNNSLIRMVTAATGIITTIAGGGSGTIGATGPATSAWLGNPRGLALDNANNLYIADTGHELVEKINLSTGIINPIAGGGTTPICQDGSVATDCELLPMDVAVDSAGNVYFTDNLTAHIFKLTANSTTLTAVAGTGIYNGMDSDGTLATQTAIGPTQGIVIDASGNIYFSNSDAAVRKIDAKTGIISTVAGNYYRGYSGDGGAAEIASLDYPQGLALDATGNLYIADNAYSVIRKVTFPPPAPTPTFGLPGATYTGNQTVSITDTTPNATIYYTTDGSTPTTDSSVYSNPLTITATETVQAIATATNFAESAVATASYTISQLTPSIDLTASANPAFAMSAVIFTATVTSTSGSPSGTVAFLDGTTQLGTGTLSGGTATFATSSLAAGSHSITAVYSGDTNFTGVTSAAVSETIEDFTIAALSGSSTSATVSPGGTATYTLSVTPPSGTTTPAAIALSISGLPTGATATFSPASVPANSGATNITLSVAVPAQSSSLAPAHSPLNRAVAPIAFGLILLPLTALRRSRRMLTRTLLLVALCATSTIGLTALSGCGGSGNGGGGGSEPQSQTYTLTVTATAGALAHTAQLTLTVN
jgi:sugar lactone lactonase YvrE